MSGFIIFHQSSSNFPKLHSTLCFILVNPPNCIKDAQSKRNDNIKWHFNIKRCSLTVMLESSMLTVNHALPMIPHIPVPNLTFGYKDTTSSCLKKKYILPFYKHTQVRSTADCPPCCTSWCYNREQWIIYKARVIKRHLFNIPVHLLQTTE